MHNLIKLVLMWKKDEGPSSVASLPRLFHAGRFHASRCLEQLPPVEGTSRPAEQLPPASAEYRSLGGYVDRLGGQGACPAEKKPGFSPLEAKHLSEQLIEDARALVEEAAAEVLGNVEPPEVEAAEDEDAPAPAAAKATGKRKERGTAEPL